MYDVAIIGAGWAGYNAAKLAQKAGLRIVIIEKDAVGGTCLNRGCIPTKAFIQSAKIFSSAKKAGTFGVSLQTPSVSFEAIQQRKETLVKQLRQGMDFMLRGIDLLKGSARLISNNQIRVDDTVIDAKNIIIASGSRSYELPGFTFDGKTVISSDDVLRLTKQPKSMLIIGGGVIGCEFAGFFAALGTKITVVEKMSQLIPGLDSDLSRKLEILFKKKGISVLTNTDAGLLDRTSFEKILVCVGRVPLLESLGLEEAGISIDKGKVAVDDYLRTSKPTVYAAGDCTGKLMLAHYAAYQGERAAWNCAHPDALKKVDNLVVPSCIFTDPEIATVGLTEKEAVNQGKHVGQAKFDFLASGMARILDETEGYVKIVYDIDSDVVLGASILGPRATELISVFSVVVTSKLTRRALKEFIFAHPTLSECIHEIVG